MLPKRANAVMGYPSPSVTPPNAAAPPPPARPPAAPPPMLPGIKAAYALGRRLAAGG